MFNDVVDNIIHQEELEQIKPDLDHNLPSTTMNSGIMNIYHNDSENFIDDPEYFLQYC